jgi:orotidine-5'-phosphate decarboxylase
MRQKLHGKGMIFAPDFIGLDDCLKILEKSHDFFSGIKIGNITLYKYGIKALKQIKKNFDIPIICDFKLMDIPDVALEILKLGEENGMDGAMIWGLAGKQIISECISSFSDKMIFVLTEFTHSRIIDENTSNQLASIALELGAYGIQAPGTRPHRISELRKIVGEKLKIISCGVGYQGVPYGTAIKYGADFEIIGRSISKAHNPALEAEKAFQSISAYS